MKPNDSNADDLRASFMTDGYVFLPGFLGKEDLDLLYENLARFLSEVMPTMPSEHVFFEDKSKPETLKQLQHIWQYDPWFDGIFSSGRFCDLAQALLADDVVPKNFQWFNKPAHIGAPTPPHQDGYYFMIEPCEAVTMWLALEDVDEENGCVRYIPGSHKHGMRPHGRTKTLGFSQEITDYGSPEEMAIEIPFPAKAGDLLVHHALTVHRADGNQSETRSRKALGFIYYAASAKEDLKAKKAYQEKLTADMLAEKKI